MSLKLSSLSSRWVYGIAIAIFFLYTAWILGPYLQSVFVRDASVTSWARVSTAPIAGKIVSEIPSVSSAVSSDGHLATIRNDMLFEEESRVAQARDRIELASTRVSDIESFVENLKQLEAQQATQRKRYADMFRAELDAALKALAQERELSANRITVLERMISRGKEQQSSDATALNSLDEMQLRLAEAKLKQADLDAKEASARLRRNAAEENVFIESDGSDPAWAQVSDASLKIQLYNAQGQLHAAKVELGEAEAAHKRAKANMKRLEEAVVSIPAGAVLLSIEVPPGARVSEGDVIARWVDCSILLVDVPVSDAELPLIKRGMKANVILEGEAQNREAEVLLTRGSTATIDQHNLAALSKGRQDGVAQVIVKLDSSKMPEGVCPVGRAAYVEFPDVGLIDVIRARLRL